jgi:RNA recognition motif-containing protein
MTGFTKIRSNSTRSSSITQASPVAAPADLTLSKSLLLRKVPRRISETDLKTVFETWGAVRDVYIPMNVTKARKESYAFIEFQELAHAIAAFNFLKNNEMLLEGVILRTDFARNGRRSPVDMITVAQQEKGQRQDQDQGQLNIAA